FAGGGRAPPPWSADSPVPAVLRQRRGGLVCERRNGDIGTKSGAFDLAALETIGTAAIVPIRHRALLRGFICLGAKRSGDIYTSTDRALLTAVGDKLSVELSRCEDEAARIPLSGPRAPGGPRACARKNATGLGL